jgi:hypothetical protein
VGAKSRAKYLKNMQFDQKRNVPNVVDKVSMVVKEIRAIKKKSKSAVMVHFCNPSTQKAETGGSRVPGQPGLHYKLEASQTYIARPYLKKENGGRKERRSQVLCTGAIGEMS